LRLNVAIVERATNRRVPGLVRPALMSDRCSGRAGTAACRATRIEVSEDDVKAPRHARAAPVHGSVEGATLVTARHLLPPYGAALLWAALR
jgi:hypothetical protein